MEDLTKNFKNCSKGLFEVGLSKLAIHLSDGMSLAFHPRKTETTATAHSTLLEVALLHVYEEPVVLRKHIVL